MTNQAEHKARMERLKASVDRRIETAQEEKGLLIVYTGAGKGKTTAALGMALRCIGPWDEGGGRAVHQGRYRYSRRARVEVFRRSSGLSSDGRRVYLGNPRSRAGYADSPNLHGRRPANSCAMLPMRWSFSTSSISPCSMTMSGSKRSCRCFAPVLRCSMS